MTGMNLLNMELGTDIEFNCKKTDFLLRQPLIFIKIGIFTLQSKMVN